VPRPADLTAAVAAIRVGDRTASARPESGPGRLGRSASSATMARLRDAAESGSTVWLAYVDRDGGVAERLVDPLGVEGGLLTAYDHRDDGRRTFLVHRITAVSPVQED
jgi:predicted DNA-binding transcriptional regulator YafY